MTTPVLINVTDVNVLFDNVYQAIVAERASLGLPPLQPVGAGTCSPSGSFQIGMEFEVGEQIAPRIVLVPTGGEFDFMTTMPQPVPNDPRVTAPRKSLYREWALFDAYIWGPPQLSPGDCDPAVSDVPFVPQLTYDFNATYELRREFISAMYDQCTGGAFRPDRAEWVQDSNVIRYGRVYVLHFRVSVPVTQEPYVYLAWSTTTGDGGVVGMTTPVITNPDGSNPYPTGITIIAPPK